MFEESYQITSEFLEFQTSRNIFEEFLALIEVLGALLASKPLSFFLS